MKIFKIFKLCAPPRLIGHGHDPVQILVGTSLMCFSAYILAGGLPWI